jgi:hypothetical protein
MAERSAVARAKDHGLTKIILESDCLSLMQRLSGTHQDRSILGAAIADIKTQKTGFESCLFRISSHVTNVVAHTLTRSAEPLVCNILVGVKELCNNIMLVNQ